MRKVDEKHLASWKKAGLDVDVFMKHPDLVDFVFKSYLHRNIAHPYYNHKIEMKLCWKDGHLVSEPHMLVDGHLTPWHQIKDKFKVDDEGRLYTMENGRKQSWHYLDQGLTRIDWNDLDHPHRLRKLDRAPAQNQVLIVTTHAHKKNWNFLDRLLKGTRHSYMRIVPGEGFSQRHPDIGLKSGEEYSFGWGTRWPDYSIYSPLSALRGRWMSPDDFEFVKQDRCITPVSVTDQQVIDLIQGIRKRSLEDRPFHYITSNCTGSTACALHDANVVDLPTKNHMAILSYKLLFPKWVRYPIDRTADFINWATPQFIRKIFFHVVAFAYSIVFAPIFTLLGAWRTNITFEDEQGNVQARVSNRAKALFSNIFDLFRPSKMEFDLTKNIYKWQKKQSNTYFERSV